MKRILFLLMFTVLSASLYAQLTLQQCQDMARNHYPELAQYDLIAQTESYNLNSASRGWIPQITLSGQATWQSATATFPEQFSNMAALQGMDLQGIPKDQYRIGLDVNQTIYDGGVSRANRKLAQADATEQRLANDVNIYGISERISDIFFSILLLDGNLATARARAELLEENARKLQSLIRGGLAISTDLDLIRVEQLTLEQQITQLEASRAAFVSMLELFIGEPLDGRNPVKPEPVILSDYVPARPELSLIDAKLARLDAQEGLLNSSVMPRVSLFAQGYYGNPGLDMFKAMTSRDWTWNAYLGVRMQWNVSALFTRDTDRNKLDITRSALKVQKETFNFNNNLITTRQRNEITRMQQALDQDDSIVELRINIRKVAQSQLDNGVTDMSSLLKRITEEYDARTTRNMHEIELLKAQYQLKYTLNQ